MLTDLEIIILLGMSVLEAVIMGSILAAVSQVVMITGISLCQKKVMLAERLSIKYNKLWVGAELICNMH